jgi:hypothetical protein
MLGQQYPLPPAISLAAVVRSLIARACACDCSGSAKKFAQRPCLGFRRIVNGKAQPYEFMTYHEVGSAEQHCTRGSSRCQCAALLCQQLVNLACVLNQVAQPRSYLPSYQWQPLACPRPGALSSSLATSSTSYVASLHHVWPCLVVPHQYMNQLTTAITLLAAGRRQGGCCGLRLRGPGPPGRRQSGHLRRQLP